MSRMEVTKRIILEHCERYPALEIQDLFKLLHQSSFGCEHLVTDLARVTNYIQEEASCMKAGKEEYIEALDGDFCRVYLDCLSQGLSVKTLGKLFYFSAETVYQGRQLLEEKLEVLLELVSGNKIDFSLDELKEAICEWKEQGYPACRHSEKYRNLYDPAYRVLRKDYGFYLSLFTKIDSMLQLGNVVLAIDGGCGSGKTTLANLLQRVYDCNVFHMDDFFLQPHQRTKERLEEAGGNVDRERFLEEVLLPIKKKESVRYRRFDCSSLTILPETVVTPKKLTVIEGSYSMHPTLSDYYDFGVFLDIDSEVQKERILKRNSPEFAARFFEMWIPMEEKYHRAFRVKEQCELIFSIKKIAQSAISAPERNA